MKNNENKIYEAPSMKVLIVELEQGIAAASGSANPSTPASVDDWTGGVDGTGRADF